MSVAEIKTAMEGMGKQLSGSDVVIKTQLAFLAGELDSDIQKALADYDDGKALDRIY